MIWNACQNVLKMTLIAAGSVLLFAASSNAADIYGGDTSVALNSGTVSALVGLGFSIAPIGPATLNGLTATFPITGGTTTTVIDHSGGLAFTKGGVTADIDDFVINLTSDKLTGNLNSTSDVTFFDIGAGGVLTLDPALAGALISVYGIPDLSGATIGVATVNAITTPTPEPASLSFCALGLIAAGLFSSRKARRQN